MKIIGKNAKKPKSVRIGFFLVLVFFNSTNNVILCRYTLDEYCVARRSAVAKSFLEALTRGGSGTSKPIELHSHDPLRYVGDMLAWLHQATASEKEYLSILLKRCTLNSKNLILLCFY